MDRKIEDVNRKISGETKLRVRYAETDKMGVVYHSNVVIWFEVGRVELLRQLGFQYKEMESEDNCHIPVVDLRVRYKAPAQYDDEIVVRTQIKNVRSSLLHFSYEIFREADRALLATGETMHIIVNSKLERTALPEKYMKAFNGLKRNS
ncbi:MAG: 4-hydroxybenzoyl-CoA thioesterase [Candidatus Angelobacter sp.]|nr:4-hydroxybenzoyl-CoA thioesterase [Candidatus Angelobacter sp.]